MWNVHLRLNKPTCCQSFGNPSTLPASLVTHSNGRSLDLSPTQYLHWNHLLLACTLRTQERDVAQSIACPPLKRSVVGSILLSGPSCSLGYFPFQPVVHNWFIKGRGMYCSVYGKVHIKDPLLLIEKSSLCGGSGFPSKKCVNVTI